VAAGCGGGSGLDLSGATQFWRQSLAQHYHGVVASGDGRGCARAGHDLYSCTAYVRRSKKDLSSGLDVIGTVTTNSSTSTVRAHRATAAEIQAWFAKYSQ
jgi:hypothetical protein